jgi:hypothetical protein
VEQGDKVAEGEEDQDMSPRQQSSREGAQGREGMRRFSAGEKAAFRLLHGRAPFFMLMVVGECFKFGFIAELCSAERYKIRRYKIQDIERLLPQGYFISCIFVSCNLYLAEKLQFEIILIPNRPNSITKKLQFETKSDKSCILNTIIQKNIQKIKR